MMCRHAYAVSAVVLCLFGALSCGSSKSSNTPVGGNGVADGGGICIQGNKGCACYPNATCNGSLVCLHGVCDQAALGGQGAAGGGGLGGDPGTVSAEDGGAGGAPGVGGTFVPSGAGGLASAVDAPGLGGLPILGGAPGLGGATGTGGIVGPDAGVGGSPSDGSSCGAEPFLNCPCSTLGALNCVGHAQKAMMMCDGSKWVPNGACAGTLVCDTSAGPGQGTCAQPLAACAGQRSAYSYCNGNSKITCGLDLLTVTGKNCPFICANGECTGECLPTSTACTGNTPMSCGYNARWLLGTPCAFDCNKGECCDATTPNLCGASCVDLQTNNSHCGACGKACASTGGKICQAGACQCPIGTTECAGTCVSLTSSDAHCGLCGNACVGGRVCQAGLCECPTGTSNCAGSCIDVQSDSANCGNCGVSCGASTCFNGNCGGGNLILNGDFSSGSTNWGVTNTTLGVTYGTSGGAFCVSLPYYGKAVVGWPEILGSTSPVPIGAGYTYTFSYTVSSSGLLWSFLAKVGHALLPYTPVYSIASDAPGTLPTQFSHNFVPIYADSGAGVAFELYAYDATTVCFDDVSLVRH